jgi:hypothetical protein
VQNKVVKAELDKKFENVLDLPILSDLNSSDYIIVYDNDGNINARDTISDLRYWLQSIFGSVFQAVLSFDFSPANGSSNPVTSDGIYDALNTKANKEINDLNNYYGATEVDSVLQEIGGHIVSINSFLSNKVDLVDGTVPASQLPSYVDDVLEVEAYASLPVTGESGKIYITLDTNKTYRWSGSGYTEISASLALGETSSTAYRGDRGKTAYDHSQAAGNPHGTTKSDVGLGNVDNTSDAGKPISTATQSALNGKQNNITNTANELFYGSGTTGSINQLAFPVQAGSVLRQDTSGAPYWYQYMTVLYNNTSGTNASFTLSESAANYDMVCIHYTRDDGTLHKSVDVWNPNSKTLSLSFLEGDASYLYFKFASIVISGTSVTWTTNGHAWVPNGGVVGINATSQPIKILRIEGFKY